MISLFTLAAGIIFELIRITIPAAIYLAILKYDRARYFFSAIGIILIATYLTTPLALLFNQSGQDLVLLIALILFANILNTIIKNSNQTINKKKMAIFILVAVFIFIIPSFSFFVNSSELLGDYIFWLKRTMLVLFLIFLGGFSSAVSRYSIRTIIIFVFIINCFGVVASYFVPEIFIVLIDADDPMLEKGLNPMGGGFFLNPNGAALSVVFSYLALFYVRHLVDRNWLILFSFMFLMALATTGSRGGFLCGLMVLAFSLKDITRLTRSNLKDIIIFFLSITVTLAILMNNLDGESVSGFSRIVDINNDGNLASNDSRWNALVSSINLALDAPFFGSGFGLRNRLLPTQPHNMYAAYAIDIGIVGLLVFPIFIVSLFKLIFTGQEKANYRITVLAILFLGLFDHEIIYSKQFAYLLFVALAVSNLLKPRISNKSMPIKANF